MTSPRHPSAAFWITVALFAVLVAYPLSFGPACWITSRTGFGSRFLPNAYRPILWLMSIDERRESLSKPAGYGHTRSGPLDGGIFGWYAQIGAAETAYWEYSIEMKDHPGKGTEIVQEEWNWLDDASLN